MYLDIATAYRFLSVTWPNQYEKALERVVKRKWEDIKVPFTLFHVEIAKDNSIYKNVKVLEDTVGPNLIQPKLLGHYHGRNCATYLHLTGIKGNLLHRSFSINITCSAYTNVHVVIISAHILQPLSLLHVEHVKDPYNFVIELSLYKQFFHVSHENVTNNFFITPTLLLPYYLSWIIWSSITSLSFWNYLVQIQLRLCLASLLIFPF